MNKFIVALGVAWLVLVVFVLPFVMILGDVVFIVFLLLKLFGVIQFNWFFVCLPIIIAVLIKAALTVTKVYLCLKNS